MAQTVLSENSPCRDAKQGQGKVREKNIITRSPSRCISQSSLKRCWALNVTNVLRVGRSPEDRTSLAAEVAAEIEFTNLTESMLLDGKILNMGELQEAFIKIRSANNVAQPECTRKQIKEILKNELPSIEFNKPKRVNEPERVTLKKTRDEAINLMEEDTTIDSDMKSLYKAASILRRAIGNAKKWTFTGKLTDSSDEHVPKELYIFYRWVIQGPTTELTADTKMFTINKNATSLAQSTMTKYLSPRQMGNRQTKTFKATHEMPDQLAIGIAIRQATRSKKIVDMLHRFGVCVEYNRLLRIEAHIASTVLERMILNNGVYMPPDVVMGRYIFFAIDNVDFAEDTPDGKRTLHGTAMAIYQRCHPTDTLPKLELRKCWKKQMAQGNIWLLHGELTAKQHIQVCHTLKVIRRRLTQSLCCTLLMQLDVVHPALPYIPQTLMSSCLPSDGIHFYARTQPLLQEQDRNAELSHCNRSADHWDQTKLLHCQDFMH